MPRATPLHDRWALPMKGPLHQPYPTDSVQFSCRSIHIKTIDPNRQYFIGNVKTSRTHTQLSGMSKHRGHTITITPFAKSISHLPSFLCASARIYAVWDGCWCCWWWWWPQRFCQCARVHGCTLLVSGKALIYQ